MTKYLISAALLATAAIAAPASAAVVNLSVPATGGSVDFGQSSATSGAIADQFVFTVPYAGDASGSIVSIDLTGFFDVAITSVKLDGVDFVQNSTGAVELWTLANTSIAAGTHTIYVTGTWGVEGGAYSGTLNYRPTAVPEPATWALMIGGFGLVGGAMRRKATKIVLA